jgi:cysteine desulfurase
LNRYYLDYNSTSPLSDKVKNFLRSGDFDFLNPASLHSSGKSAKKIWNESTQNLKNQLELKNHELIVTSCASESLSQLIQTARENDYLMIYSPTDHAAIVKNVEQIESYSMPITKAGELDVEKVILDLKNHPKKKMIFFTMVHNETGWVWDLSLALKLKNELDAIIVVDAVQAIGKVENLKLDAGLDAYVFSPHKWGGMKGVGLTFIKESIKVSSLIKGGAQQSGLRAGTQNVLGLITAELALHDVANNEEIKKLRLFRDQFKNELKKIANIKVFDFKHSNANTIFLGLPKRGDQVLPILDINGFEVSFGSACSSGTAVESHVMKALGENQYLHHSLRISLGSKNYSNELISNFISVLQKAIS